MLQGVCVIPCKPPLIFGNQSMFEGVNRAGLVSFKPYYSLIDQGWDIDERIFLNGRKEFRFSKKYGLYLH